jgi:predicted nucleic acid-binding Zn ribbon protein
LPEYVFRCDNPECDTHTFSTFESIQKDKKYDTRPCPACGVDAERHFSPETMPGVKFVGLGFASTDAEYEKQLKKAEAIAEAAPAKRAEIAEQGDKLSQDDEFWNMMADGDYDVKKYKEKKAKPPTIVSPEMEAKASRNIARDDGSPRVKATPK